LVLFVSLALGGTAAGFALATPARPPRLAPPALSRGIPVLVAAGYGTSWNGGGPAPLPGRYQEWRFSYRGLGPSGPLAYSSADTDQPIARLAALMASQVDALHARTGRPVDVVSESEASLVTEAYLASAHDPPVAKVILLSPLLRTGRVFYPPSGRSGWGMAGGAILAGLDDVVGPMAPDPLPPSGPFLRSIIDAGPKLGLLGSCAPATVREVAILPLADALASPAPVNLSIPSVVVPDFHGGMVGQPSIDRLIKEILAGETVHQDRLWSLLETAVGSGASAWQVPALDSSLESDWANPSPRCPTATAG
jgi:hypothetical protein